MSIIPQQRTASRYPGAAQVTRLAAPPPTGVVPVASTQGTLALDLHDPTGLPATPELRVVRGGRDALEAWAARFAQAVVEVIAGDRAPNQLVRCTSAAVHEDLQRRAALLNRLVSPDQRLRRLRAQVRSVHVFSPGAESAEFSVHVRQGERSRAIAARIEWLDARWICVALEFG